VRGTLRRFASPVAVLRPCYQSNRDLAYGMAEIPFGFGVSSAARKRAWGCGSGWCTGNAQKPRARLGLKPDRGSVSPETESYT
jgi:hypothetical protein